MNERRGLSTLVFYIVLLLLFALGLWWALSLGSDLPTKVVGAQEATASNLSEAFGIFSQSVHHHAGSTIGLLLVQILVILISARIMGTLFQKIGQPAVIGEIVAGIMLGPSLLGRFAPEAFGLLFPTESIGNIQLLSNFGLILFMFVVGMELRLGDIRERLSSSLVVSHAGIFIPFAMSLPLSYAIYERYAATSTTFVPFALFVGIAMSITAFPVLARIVQENNLQRTHLGKLALSSAAAGDITAWLMLAAIIAISQSGSLLSMVYNLAFLVAYLLVMFGVIRPLFKVAGKVYNNTEVISHTLVGVIFILLLLSSYVTELLSMHALFGAFMLGLIMPEDLSFRKILTDKVEDVSLMLFLPLFFVSSGLQTELGLIDGVDMWVLFGIFTLIAVVGKVGGTYISARAAGETTKDSIYLGAFMNTRGLMELVVLAIGYEMGILPASIYTVLVLMTVVTTVMTMPLVQLINKVYAIRAKRNTSGRVPDKQGYKVLLSFGRPSSGATLLRLTNQLLTRGEHKPRITALHITTDKNIGPIEADKYFQDSFHPILSESERIGQAIDVDYIVSDEVERTILSQLTQGQYNLLIVGTGIKLSNQNMDQEAAQEHARMRRRLGNLSVNTTERLLSIHNMLKDKMDYFLQYAPSSVGILLSKSFSQPKRILIEIYSQEDLRMLPYARSIAENNGGRVGVYVVDRSIQPEIVHEKEDLIMAQGHSEVALYLEYDFMIVSPAGWAQVYQDNPERLAMIPSTLILKLK